MSGMQPEARLVSAIRTELLARMPGAVVLKLHGSPFSYSGTPDLLVFFSGRVWALEVKRRTNGETAAQARARTTKLQVAMIRRLRATGIRTDVVTSVQEAWDIVRDHKNPYYLDTEIDEHDRVPL